MYVMQLMQPKQIRKIARTSQLLKLSLRIYTDRTRLNTMVSALLLETKNKFPYLRHITVHNELASIQMKPTVHQKLQMDFFSF